MPHSHQPLVLLAQARALVPIQVPAQPLALVQELPVRLPVVLVLMAPIQLLVLFRLGQRGLVQLPAFPDVRHL